MKDNKSNKPILFKANNFTSFLYGFFMPVITPLQNKYSNAFTLLLTLLISISGFFICMVGTGESKLKKNDRNKSFNRVASAWLGMALGFIVMLYISKKLGVK